MPKESHTPAEKLAAAETLDEIAGSSTPSPRTRRAARGVSTTSIPPVPAEFFTRSHPVIKAYLEKVRAWHGNARFIGLPALVETSKDVPLERLYVPPHLSKGHLSPEAMDDGKNLPPTLPLIATLKDIQRLVVLGDPGSGKSTLINFICDSLARPALTELRQQIGTDLVPLPFTLRELGVDEQVTWESLRDAFLERPVGLALGSGDLERRQMFDSLLESGQGWVMLDGIDEIGSRKVREKLRWAFAHGLLRNPTARFLLTSRVIGYEEVAFDVANESIGSEPRLQFGNGVNIELMNGPLSVERQSDAYLSTDPANLERWFANPFNHAIDEAASALLKSNIASSVSYPVTSRLYLVPFNDKQVRDFTRNWWMHHRANPALAVAESEEFLAALHAKPDTRTLGRVPNLLVLIALIYKVFVKLPDGRGALYWRIAEAYLENIDRHYKLGERLPYDFKQMANWLSHVAWHMQLRRYEASTMVDKGKKTAHNPAADILITEEDATKLIADAIQAEEGKSRPEAMKLATTFLDYVARRSGLFIPRGQQLGTGLELYAFIHLSFQEFFAAVYLRERVGSEVWLYENILSDGDKSGTAVSRLREYAVRAEWIEVFVFLFEMLGEGDKTRPLSRLRALLGEEPQGSSWPSLDTSFANSLGDLAAGDGNQETLSPAMVNGRLVELAALLGMNSEVALTPLARKALLSRCWEWASRRAESGGSIGNNIVARQLTARRGTSDTSWAALRESAPKILALDLTYCSNFVDVDKLVELPNLKRLVLNGMSGILDLESIAKIGQLRCLILVGLPDVSDLRPLTRLKFLEDLFLTGCDQIDDIRPLSELKLLKVLDLSRTDVSDLTAIAGLRSLKIFFITDCTGLTDLYPIAGMSSLVHISIKGCTGVKDVAPLAELSALQGLHLEGCSGISEDQIDRLKMALPSCNIEH